MDRAEKKPGTVAAALNIVESKERRAFFIAGAEFFSERDFFNGFTNDGYCSEGMGYWNYGFGNYLQLSAEIRYATHGKVDMLRFPKVRAVLDYAPTLEIDKGIYAVFADCAAGATPSAPTPPSCAPSGWGWRTPGCPARSSASWRT